MQDILSSVEKWLSQGESVALATVVSTWGSSPRQAGAKLAVTAQMAMVGSVSGGCVETAVVQEAIDGLADRKPRLLHFGVSDDTAWTVGLACGGKIDVYVEPLDRAWWDQAAALVKAHRPFVTVTIIAGSDAGQKILFEHDNPALYRSPGLTDAHYGAMLTAAHEATQSGRRQITANQPDEVMIDVYQPLPRLFLVGGAHVAVALARYAKIMGWRVSLIDPRRVFATEARFPEVDDLSFAYPDKALVEYGIDADSYIAILTHDPKIDDPALRVALPSAAPYVGILSSKRSHQQRVERLTKAGLPSALLDRIHVPIGLDIAAQTPEEVALCIMAEIVGVRNGAIARKAAAETAVGV